MYAWVILQVVLAVFYASLIEWLVHKYILHALGSRKIAFRAHWHRHHRNCALYKYADPDYRGGLTNLSWDARWGEVFGLGFLGLIHLPMFFVAPVMYGGVLVWCVLYYTVHATSHVYPKFGKRYFPWHYRHHMGKDQNKNWGVTTPFWDWVFGTRVLD